MSLGQALGATNSAHGRGCDRVLDVEVDGRTARRRCDVWPVLRREVPAWLAGGEARRIDLCAAHQAELDRLVGSPTPTPTPSTKDTDMAAVGRTAIEAVTAHITTHPGLTARQVAEALGFVATYGNNALADAERKGLVRRSKGMPAKWYPINPPTQDVPAPNPSTASNSSTDAPPPGEPVSADVVVEAATVPDAEAAVRVDLDRALASLDRMTRDATAREGMLARQLNILRAAERDRDEAQREVARLTPLAERAESAWRAIERERDGAIAARGEARDLERDARERLAEVEDHLARSRAGCDRLLAAIGPEAVPPDFEGDVIEHAALLILGYRADARRLRSDAARYEAELADMREARRADEARYRIVCDPETQGGYPCVRGRRVTIDALQADESVADLAAAFDVDEADVLAARVVYAALPHDTDTDDDRPGGAAWHATIWTERDEIGWTVDERTGLPALFARGHDGVDVRIVVSTELVSMLGRQGALAAALSREHVVRRG